MYVMATSCWGSRIDKWSETSPEYRFQVVKAVLERKALPLALEVPQFTFAVEGPSRAAFDQLARTRIGATFSAKGMRDNNWKDCSIRIPTSLWPTEEEFKIADSLSYANPEDFTEAEKKVLAKVANFHKVKRSMLEAKATYASIVDSGKASWQAARTVLPLYVVYGYSVTYNFASLLGVCGNRMKFCEMEDTCAVAWLTRNVVFEKFPLLGSYLRPGCDWGKKCQYHKSYSMSEMFGCLFSECGRNPCQESDKYAEFNETCTDPKVLEEQLGIEIYGPEGWPAFDNFESLSDSDRYKFLID
jgi:hypothetical protein